MIFGLIIVLKFLIQLQLFKAHFWSKFSYYHDVRSNSYKNVLHGCSTICYKISTGLKWLFKKKITWTHSAPKTLNYLCVRRNFFRFMQI